MSDSDDVDLVEHPSASLPPRKPTPPTATPAGEQAGRGDAASAPQAATHGLGRYTLFAAVALPLAFAIGTAAITSSSLAACHADAANERGRLERQLSLGSKMSAVEDELRLRERELQVSAVTTYAAHNDWPCNLQLTIGAYCEP